MSTHSISSSQRSYRHENEKHIQNLHSLGLLPKRAVVEAHKLASGPSNETASRSSGRHHAQESVSSSSRSNTNASNTTKPANEFGGGGSSLGREASRKQKDKRHLGYASVNQTWQPPSYSNGTQTSFNWRSGRPGAGMLDMERSRTRRERTFIGSECAVCEEPLEHTLRGERILQFSCGHVSHEACFYEYIKEFDSQYCPTCNAPLGLDTSRGGNVLDLEKLSSIVRSVSMNNEQREREGRSSQSTPTPWDEQAARGDRPRSRESNHRYRESNNNRGYNDSRHADQRGGEQYGGGGSTISSGVGGAAKSSHHQSHHSHGHARNASTGTGIMSSQGDYESQNGGNGRPHEYDLQAMEHELNSPRMGSNTRNPIPPPIVTVRSEYPTLNRSKQPQTLTCLITVEVAESKWLPHPDDLRNAPQAPTTLHQEKEVVGSPPKEDRSGWTNETPEELEEITDDLRMRVENWHGLDFTRFGALRLHGTLRVSRDKSSWQELECFLFAEMLICIKEKRGAQPVYAEGNSKRKLTKCTLRGSILIKKHLKNVEPNPDEPILTLSLAVQELPQFHLQFTSRSQVGQWKRALLDLNAPQVQAGTEGEQDLSGTDDDDYRVSKTKRVSSMNSSWGAARSTVTAPTEYTNSAMGGGDVRLPAAIHVPLDLVVVIPVSSSMQGLKITLLRDALKFLVQNLGTRDRMGLVTFGSSGGGVPLVGMTTKTWGGWSKVLNSIRPVGQKSLRADVVEGANVAMDLLMQRKSNNPIASIILISDSSTSDGESVDFVVSRAEAAKIGIHSFGLGLTHKPDTMIELSTRTKASYTYVKDWMMLRECVAGCLGSMQTASHQNAKLKLRLPEGSPAKFAKISGALQITKRTAGREAEAALGDLRFGDKRDILVQLVIAPDHSSEEHLPQDHWESIVSGLEALGGSYDGDEPRATSVEEVPLIQADLTFGDVLREGTLTHLPRPSLLAITMLPANPKASKSNGRPATPPIPPHPSIVQRRMELLTSDMLTRALYLVSRGQHDRAHHLLHETRSILKGLAKGGLPPIPPKAAALKDANAAAKEKERDTREGTRDALGNQLQGGLQVTGASTGGSASPNLSTPALGTSASNASLGTTASTSVSPSGLGGAPTIGTSTAIGTDHNGTPERQPSPQHSEAGSTGGTSTYTAGPGIDTATLGALDAELESSLEWINHPAVFGRDSRKAVLQAIGVISSQRGYTFRTASETLWAARIGGVRRLTARSREWREVGEGESLAEEA